MSDLPPVRSLSEQPVSEAELAVLMMLRAHGVSGLVYAEAIDPPKVRAYGRRLALRGYARIEHQGSDLEHAFITPEGLEASLTKREAA